MIGSQSSLEPNPAVFCSFCSCSRPLRKLRVWTNGIGLRSSKELMITMLVAKMMIPGSERTRSKLMMVLFFILKGSPVLG